MTSTRAINAAAGVIHACMQQGKSLPQTIAYALDSAGLLNSPEIAAELEHLRKLPAERAADHRTWKHDLASLREARDEADRLRARVAELEAAAGDGSTRTADEDPITYALTAEAEALHASSGAVIETTTEVSVDPNGCGRCGIPKDRHGRQWTLSAGWHPWTRPTDEQIKERMLRRRSVNELRALLAGQREDVHDSELHHTYAIPRDFPEVRP